MLASALLELHGLQDTLEKLRAWVAEAEEKMTETEGMPISNDMEVLEGQLSAHEVRMCVHYVPFVHVYVDL